MPMVAPRSHQERATIIFGQVIRLIGDDTGGCLPGTRYHSKRTWQFPVPRGERVQSLAAVAKAVAIVAAVDNVQKRQGGRESGSLSTANNRPKISNAR